MNEQDMQACRKYEQAMDVNEKKAGKKDLRRKIKAMYQLIDDYSDIEEKLSAQCTKLKGEAATLNAACDGYLDDLNQAEAELAMAYAVIDDYSEFCDMLIKDLRAAVAAATKK